MELPLQLREAWHAQGFYGSVSHNVKAIYQRYMTWFDGNPAHLWEHPPTEAAKRYVSCMGGVEEVLQKAKRFYEEGDLRFAVTLLNHAIYADPENQEAKCLLASMYEILGYVCENGPWRNFYISGAMELRGFRPKKNVLTGQTGMSERLSLHHLFASLAVRLDGIRAQEQNFVLDLYVIDRDEHCRLIVSNGALIHRTGQQACNKSSLEKVAFFGTISFHKLMQALTGDEKGQEGNSLIDERGDRSYWQRLLSLLVTPNPAFNIVVP